MTTRTTNRSIIVARARSIARQQQRRRPLMVREPDLDRLLRGFRAIGQLIRDALERIGQWMAKVLAGLKES